MTNHTLQFKPVRFAPQTSEGFFNVLNREVDQYFKEKKINKYANWNMKLKTLTMLLIYFVPYGFIVSGTVVNTWLFYGLWSVMGLGLAFIGLSIMHDANHGSYSTNTTVNNMLGLLLDVIGGNATNWKIQHNVLHHTYTNVEGLDDDIKPAPILRFSKHAPLKSIHKFQYIYAWFFYGLMTLSWVVMKDFKQIKRYDSLGLLKGQKTTYQREFIRLVVVKLAYITYAVVIPILFSGFSWGHVLGAFCLMHFIGGLTLGLIFQPAHVMEETEYPLPVEGNNMKNSWAEHQMLNTVNFASKDRVFSWFVGGLNYQIEHHLFPTMCHVHYRAISPIVKRVAAEFGLPYYEHKTFRGAVWYHGKMLKKLGEA